MAKKIFGMNAVCKRTGLTSHAIRAWEKRYSTVTPIRSDTNRRLYNEDHVKRLKNLKLLTDNGHNIGQIANLDDSELDSLVGSLQLQEPSKSSFFNKNTLIQEHLNRSIESIMEYDSIKLQSILDKVNTELGSNGLINDYLIPLMENIGELWRKGTIRTAHEHTATQVVRTFIGSVLSNIATHVHKNAPGIIVTTPTGHIHELGAMIAALTAATEGWNVCYPGPNLPSEEIAGAAASKGSRAVAISLIYPNFDTKVLEELQKLSDLLSSDVYMLIGGRASENYRDKLTGKNIIFIDSVDDFRDKLEYISNS